MARSSSRLLRVWLCTLVHVCVTLRTSVRASGRVMSIRTRTAPPRMQLEPAATLLNEYYPHPSMSPRRVVEIQCLALQQSGYRVFWRFVSPEGKRATGELTRGFPARHYPYLAPPKYEDLPLYTPLIGARRFEIVGALVIDDVHYQCRVRVWPAGSERECGYEAMPAPPVEYIWRLALQPTVRPTCYEDDPLQQGISTGPPFGGCWLVDEVTFDDRWSGSDDGEAGAPHGPSGGGNACRAPLQSAKRVGVLLRH